MTNRLLLARRSCLILGMLAAISMSACREEEAVQLQARSQSNAIQTSVAVVAGRDEPVTIEATGSFEAAESSDVAPESAGVVIATPVDVGAFVRDGAVLVRLQETDSRLAVDEARAARARAESNAKLADAQRQLAETTAKRYQSLLATGDVSNTVADQARTEAETALQSANTARASLAEAAAKLARAEHDMSHVAVVAPFAGFVQQRHVSVGEYVQPSTPVVTLLMIDPLRLRLAIPAARAGQVKVGQKVTAMVDAYPGEVFTGQLSAVTPALDPQSRTLLVEAQVANPKDWLKPGMFAVAAIAQGEIARTLLVPRRAIIEDVNTNSYRLYVVDEQNHARVRVLQLAARQLADPVRVTSGVKEGERVATANLSELYDGAVVEIAAP